MDNEEAVGPAEVPARPARPGWRRVLPWAVAGAVGLFAALWYFRAPVTVDATVLRAGRLTVYEGLPHPMYEEEAFRDERKSGKTVELDGFPFYRDPLVLKPEDVNTLRDLLGSPSTFLPYSGEKKCGGFHPDYAVEWSSGGGIHRALICFGCFEVKVRGPREERWYDLRVGNDRSMKLLRLLKAYRQSRPPHERFGNGPLAGSGGTGPKFLGAGGRSTPSRHPRAFLGDGGAGIMVATRKAPTRPPSGARP